MGRWVGGWLGTVDNQVREEYIIIDNVIRHGNMSKCILATEFVILYKIFYYTRYFIRYNIN